MGAAERSLEHALKRQSIEYKTIPGEAAFYGPKIDIKLVDAIGRLWQNIQGLQSMRTTPDESYSC
ncbi:MAG TPA: hypothetical protein VFC15_15435 [Candidatus Limnocylindrales bacterium]|jgi:threonyl-tRNA synthetase|nr:hypothetical protein [Candidatus Limnocylindrales bacterium]